MLCQICTTAFLTGSLASKLLPSHRNPLPHHATAHSFAASVHRKCTVCTAVHGSAERRGRRIWGGDGAGTGTGKRAFTMYLMQVRKKYQGTKAVTVYWMEAGERWEMQMVFSLERAEAIEPLLRQPNHHSSSDQPGHSLSLARHWINTCKTSHPICNSRTPSTLNFIPTRLLDLEKLTASRCALCITATDPGAYTSYTTLSHRWGNDPQFLCLSSSNIQNLRVNGILISSLPATFQDAIAVTRALGVRYIWIDSLCIMQDSTTDWQLESSAMQNVYSHSDCNIAALWVDDSSAHGFLLCAPGGAAASYCKVQAHWTDLDSDSNSLPAECSDKTSSSYYIFSDGLFGEHVSLSQLLTRGWVLQERILPSRVLYFTPAQLFWECHSQTACEAFPLKFPPQMHCTPGDSASRYARPSTGQIAARGEPLHRNPYGFWKLVVDAYVGCELTNTSDKLVAVSGLAQLVASLTGDTYLAGLWRSHLQRHLLWSVVDPPSTTVLQRRAVAGDEEYRAPSWSWASVDGNARLSHHYAEPDNVSLVDILSAWVDSVTADPTGQIGGGEVRLEGILMTASFDVTRGRSASERLLVAGEGAPKVFAQMDIVPQTSVDDLSCLPFYHFVGPEVDGQKGDVGVEGLVLRRVTRASTARAGGDGEERYSRIGTFMAVGRMVCRMARVEFRSFGDGGVEEEVEDGQIGVRGISGLRQCVVLV